MEALKSLLILIFCKTLQHIRATATKPQRSSLAVYYILYIVVAILILIDSKIVCDTTILPCPRAVIILNYLNGQDCNVMIIHFLGTLSLTFRH